MTDRIEYLYDLGVTCLWLMPVSIRPPARTTATTSPISSASTQSQLSAISSNWYERLAPTAIRVIVDFVMNHTSDRHPWFESARRSEQPYRDYYVWSADKPKSSAKDVVFPDQETSLWERDAKTNEYYLHHFYKHQPDLDIENPEVQEEISRTLGFWLELGVSGFRVSASRSCSPRTPRQASRTRSTPSSISAT